MRGATLFSGIGCAELAGPGIDWRWCAEIDPFARAVLAARFPDTPNLGDVTAPDFIEKAAGHGAIDVLIFGSPCQSFSVAGKRGGLDDDRGNLALVALRIARSLRPKWLVFENVPGMLSSGDGDDFATFLGAMAECGYHGAWRILDAQFAGVPQRRRRVFFVGYLGNWRPPAAVLLEPASLRGHPPPRRKAGKGVAGTVTASTGGSDENDASDGRLIAGTYGGGNTSGPIDVATACTAHGVRLDYDSETFVAFTCKDYGADAGATAPTLRAMGHDGSRANGGGQEDVFFQAKASAHNSMNPGEVGPSLDVGKSGGLSVQSGMMVRRLTPLECERLQGLPDGYTAITCRGKPAADGPRYRAIGNGMAVPVVRWILDRIAMFEEVTPS